MISTMPLDEITQMIDEAEPETKKVGSELIFSSTHVIGVGLRGELPDRIGDKCEWTENRLGGSPSECFNIGC